MSDYHSEMKDLQERLAAIQKENEQLKKELTRLRVLLAQKSVGSMSSKLKDALRE
jgi:regulator of replication initiation timing